jgi:hypothetical protein
MLPGWPEACLQQSRTLERHMKRWLIGGIILGLGVALAACAEQRSDAPLGLVAHHQGGSDGSSCDLRSANQLASQYFNSAQAETARSLIAQMGAAGAGSVTARDRGFDLFALIAGNVQAGTGGDPAVGSSLINAVTPCMFVDPAELPATFPEDYTIAVTTAAPGGLGVRGGASDPADAVLSRGSFSGVGPQFGGTWAAMLAGNPAPNRLLLYGRPGSTPNSYDWKVLPRNAAFNPAAIVGVCIDPNTATTSMVNEEHVGVLTYSDAYFLDPATCGSLGSRTGVSWWTHQLARVFLPRPLSASAVATRGGIGGSTGGIGSEFSANNVPNVGMSFTIQPPATVRVGEVFSVQIRASDPVTGATVGGTQISIIQVNNNGKHKTLLGTLTQTTNNAGIATFADLAFGPGSTGAFRLVASGAVLGRPAISVGQVTSTKVNSKPAK